MEEDYGSRIEQLEAELQSIKRGDNNTIVGFVQGIGSAILLLTVGEVLVWYLNWFCVWMIYWLIVHILPFRIIYDLRFAAWAVVFLGAGFWGLPASIYGYLAPNGVKSKKTTTRSTGFLIVLIPGLIIWFVYFIRFLIHVPW